MQTKICSRCGELKPISSFHKRSDRITGVQSHCKECQRKRKRAYLATPDGEAKRKAYSLKQYWENKETILRTNKEWRESNKEYRKKYLDDYENDHRTRKKEDVRRWSNKSQNKRYATDSKYRLCRIISSGIRRSLGARKNGYKWEDLVDFTYADLVAHLKKTLPAGYRWEDYENNQTDLHIDHIIPISAFNYTSHTDIDFKRCWDLKNLRLYPRFLNLAKGNSLSEPFQPSLSF